MGRYSKDRHEYNNKLTGISNNSCLGMDIFIQLIIIVIGVSIYAIYRLYKYIKKKKRAECKNTNIDDYHNSNYTIMYYVNNEKYGECKNVKV